MDIPSGTAKKPVVLVVEDDVFLVKAYQVKLEKEGFEVWVAMDGKEANAMLTKQPPSVVLLDMMLPFASGFDILQSIRNVESWKQVPVIVLTNLGQNQDIERAKTLGVAEYLVKANTKISDIAEKAKKYASGTAPVPSAPQQGSQQPENPTPQM